MFNKLIIVIFLIMQTVVISQWSDPAYSKIDPSNQESERYKLMDKMSINLKESDIRNVLTMIGELTGLNIVISPNIEDTITANFENVTVKAALDAILKPNNYSYFVQDNIIIVKDYLGTAYLPEWNFNGIGNIKIGQGYQIKTTMNSSLTISGDYLFPEQNPLYIGEIWNMIGY